jgi:SAM-dependent MidA family methyltransferase
LQIAESLIDIVRERGRMTVAAFMELALYDPTFGYYARAPRRSGRAGDFFTSVDVGPLFGDLLAVQIGEMARLMDGEAFDLVEAGAGNGRLAADVVSGLAERFPDILPRIRLHLVEASAPARAAQESSLRAHVSSRRVHKDPPYRSRPVPDSVGYSSSRQLPESFEGVLYANELLDAFPVHQVVMRKGGLREVFVECRQGTLVTTEGPPSTPALADYLSAAGATLSAGAHAEVNLQAVSWVRDAARRLRRGFIILIDYGHEAHELYSPTHAQGTLTSFTGHVAAGPASGVQPSWLANPGDQDITAHVDFTSVRNAAEAEGLITLGLLDQTYFLLGLANISPNPENPENLLNPLNPLNPLNLSNPSARRAFSTLMMPGGLGSTMKVLILGKHVGRPSLAGCSYRTRLT